MLGNLSRVIFLWNIEGVQHATIFDRFYEGVNTVLVRVFSGQPKEKITRADQSRMRNWVTHPTHRRRSLKLNSHNMVKLPLYYE